MTTILIPTIRNDIHAAAVAHVLREMGHHPIRWFCQDLPEAATASCSIGRESERIVLQEGSLPSAEVQDVDVLWNRRVGDPVVKNPEADPGDRQVARNEMKQMLRGLMATVSRRAFAVNDYGAARSAGKIQQLCAARRLGLRIPETLISNDPARIKAFLRAHETDGTIFKSFRPVVWTGSAGSVTLFTHQVTMDQLPSDVLLQMSPGIFQAMVPKAFEVRVTCMGAQQFAVKLDSQSRPASRIDWRLEDMNLPMVPLPLPAEIAAACRSLMQRLGLVFGCFDFIVTPEGDYVFLEINQMGQFLWVEEVVPELPLLDAFCQFLISRDPDFRYSPGRTRFPFAEICPAAEAMIDEDLTKHVEPDEYWQMVREGVPPVGRT